MDLRIKDILWRFDSEKRSMDKTLSWIMGFPMGNPIDFFLKIIQPQLGNPYSKHIKTTFPLDFPGISPWISPGISPSPGLLSLGLDLRELQQTIADQKGHQGAVAGGHQHPVVQGRPPAEEARKTSRMMDSWWMNGG